MTSPAKTVERVLDGKPEPLQRKEMKLKVNCLIGVLCIYLLLASFVQHTRYSTLQNGRNSGRNTVTQSYSYFFYQQPEYPRDCKDALNKCSISNSSGVQLIKPSGYTGPFEVHCRNEDSSNGWTLIGRRIDGSVSFNRNWTDFRNGFGFPSGEFWLGNDKLSHLTNQGVYDLSIDVDLYSGSSFNVVYNSFRISDEWGQYAIVSVGSYTVETGRFCPETHCVVPYIKNGRSVTQGGSTKEYGTCFEGSTSLYIVCNERTQPAGSYSCRHGEIESSNPDVQTLCTRELSNEHEQLCSPPGVVDLVQTFVGSDYTPLTEQQTFRQGDFITSRCHDPKSQKLQGSVIRRCEGGQWSGQQARCESANFAVSVVNTRLHNITENGTLVVYPVSGYVIVDCRLLRGHHGDIRIYKDDVVVESYQDNYDRNLRRYRIYNPSPSDSGTYRCESGGQSHSIVIVFRAITCPRPVDPDIGSWRHNPAGANPTGDLGYIFMETVSLVCPIGYRLSDSSQPRCTHHGTWSRTTVRCIRDQ